MAEKIFFIDKRRNFSFKNSLDEMLHKAFNQFNDCLISDSNLGVLDDLFHEVVAKYKANKGRSRVPEYKRYVFPHGKGEIIIEISESCEYVLRPIKGEYTA